MIRKAIVAAGAMVALAGIGQAPVAGVAAGPAVPSFIRDTMAAKFDITPPAPLAAHPEVIQPDTQIEPSIAANPTNPLNVVTDFQEGRVAGGGDQTNGYATTFDGGRTWTHGELPCLTYSTPTPLCPAGGPYDRASDAVVAFGTNNVVYANSLVFNDSTQTLPGGVAGATLSAMAVNVSKDGGKTWSLPVFFQSDNQLVTTNDKNWVVVDNGTGVTHHPGRVYVVWDRVAPVVYNYCDSNCDVATNWLPNFLTAFPGQGIGSIPLVLADGSLGIVFTTITTVVPSVTPTDQPQQAGATELSFAYAPGAGAVVWPMPLTFTQVPISIEADNANPIRYQRASDGLEAAAIDPVTGQMYVVWDDGRFRGGAPVNDVVYSTSTDNGLTWTPAARVNDDSTGDFIDHYTAMVSVGPDSVVHVAYRQRQEAADVSGFSRTIHTFHQQSVDHGKTWTGQMQVDRGATTDALYGAFSRAGLFEGDYNEAASSGPYTYMVREEAYPLFDGETPGLVLSGGAYTGNPQGCPGGNVVPSCLTHLHQRTYVAVVGPAETTAAATPPAATPGPTPSPVGASPLPNTGPWKGGPLVPLMAGIALAGLATLLGSRVSAARPR